MSGGGVGIIGGAGADVGTCMPPPMPTPIPAPVFMFSVDGFSELSKACTRCASARREVSCPCVPYAL